MAMEHPAFLSLLSPLKSPCTVDFPLLWFDDRRVSRVNRRDILVFGLRCYRDMPGSWSCHSCGKFGANGENQSQL